MDISMKLLLRLNIHRIQPSVEVDVHLTPAYIKIEAGTFLVPLPKQRNLI